MSRERATQGPPAGGPKTVKQTVLEAGASVLQDIKPLKQFDIYVIGLHCGRHEPGMQMEAHHFCRQVNADFLQCVLFDANEDEARLMGVEYIISERLFESLPEQEQGFWHPHNYEILSGTLVGPGLPEAAEKAMLGMLMNSYGKTWHTWHTGMHEGEAGDALPVGPARLMWSFNRDGEIDPRLLEHLDVHLTTPHAEKRQNRQDMVAAAHPQHGVDALKGAFPGAEEEPPPGVEDVEAVRVVSEG